MELAKTIGEYKAVSVNVMHSSVKITDQVYSRLSEDEVYIKVEQLSKVEIDKQGGLEADFKLFEQFLEWRKSKKE